MMTLKNMSVDLTTLGSPLGSSQCTTFRPNFPEAKFPPKPIFNPFAKNIDNDKWILEQDSIQILSNTSYLNSESQLTSTFLQDQKTQVNGLSTLEQKITQQLLLLREQKLTLMEEQNQVTENKLKIQRELNKIKKKIYGNGNQQNVISDREKTQFSTDSSDLAQEEKKGELFLHQKMMEQRDREMVREIASIEETNEEMEQNLSEFEQSEHSSSGSKISEQTHEPGKIKRNGRSSYDQKSKQSAIVQGIRLKREKLLKKMTNKIQQQSLREHLLTLIASNHELQAILDHHEYKFHNKLQLLREKVQKEEKNKIGLLEDMVTWKSKCKHLKLQNQQLRNALSYCRK